jgi:hypothetical protein
MLSSLKTLIDDNATDIGNNTTAIGDNTTNIGINTTDIATNTSAIADLQPEAWIEVNTFNSGWDNAHDSPYATLQYRVDPYGMLHLFGTVTNSDTPAGNTIFVLPVGYRPESDVYYVAYDSVGGLFTIKIGGDGSVDAVTALGSGMQLFITVAVKVAP